MRDLNEIEIGDRVFIEGIGCGTIKNASRTIVDVKIDYGRRGETIGMRRDNSTMHLTRKRTIRDNSAWLKQLVSE